MATLDLAELRKKKRISDQITEIKVPDEPVSEPTQAPSAVPAETESEIVSIRRPGEPQLPELSTNAPDVDLDDNIVSIRRPEEQDRPSTTDIVKGVLKTTFQPQIQSLEAGDKLAKFLFQKGVTEPGEAAPIVREYLADLVSTGPAEIEAEARQTGKVNFKQITGRVTAESISDLIPMTPTDVALFALIPAVGKGLGLAFPTAARFLKTPVSQLGSRVKAIQRFGGKAPKLLGPTGQPTAPPVRPRPLIDPTAQPKPTQPILTKPPKQFSEGPIMTPEELSRTPPHLRKDFLSPIDKTKPVPLQMADAKRLSKPAANQTEAIIPQEGPLVLSSENQVRQGGALQTFQREWIDRITPLKGIPAKGIAPEFEQAGGRYSKSYVVARLLKGKVRGKSEILLERVNEVVAPLKSHKERLWLNEIYSMKNFRDLDRIGRTTSGMTEEVTTSRLSQLQKKIGAENFKRIEKVADDLANIQNNEALEILVEAKMITPKVAKELRTRFPNYLRSEVLDENLAHQFPQFIASGGEAIGRINRSFLKEKKGTTRMINTDVLDVIRRSLISKVAAAEKQKVVDQVAKEFGVQIGKTIDAGKIVTIVDPKAIPPGFKQTSAKASGGRIFAVSEDIERILQGMNTQEADIVTRAMGAYNNLFRLSATTWRLPFVVNNIKRDVATMFFNKRVLPGQKSSIVASLEASVTAIKDGFGVRNELFKKFLDSGAAFGGIVTEIPKGVKVPFRLRPPGEKLRDVTKRIIGLPLDEVGRLAQISENIPRLTEFIRLKGTKLPPELRALNARDVTIDFEKSGDAMKVANRWIPFLNAQVQGELNTLRAFKDQPLISTARIVTQMAIPAISLYSWNRQFKNNDTIDPFIKENYWYVNSGMTIERENVEVPILFLARKGEAAKWFTAPMELFMEWSENDPAFAARMKEYNGKNLMSAMTSRVMPPLLGTIAQDQANFDFFRRRPVVPQRLQDVESGQQFTTFTSNTARLVGEGTGLSPVRLESAARSLFPVTPMMFEGSDLVLKTLGEQFPELKKFVTPEIPRKPKEKLRQLEAFFPTVRAPSGFFSPQKAEAQTFLEEKRVEAKTPRFLFQESFSQFLRDKTPENRKRMMELGKGINGKDRARLMKQEIKRFNQSKKDQRTQAIQRLPKRLQPEFQRRLRERGL